MWCNWTMSISGLWLCLEVLKSQQRKRATGFVVLADTETFNEDISVLSGCKSSVRWSYSWDLVRSPCHKEYWGLQHLTGWWQTPWIHTLPLQRRPSLRTLYLWKGEHVVTSSLELNCWLVTEQTVNTCNRSSLVDKAPVVCALLVLFQIVSHYFRSSSVAGGRPWQIDAVFKGTEHFGCCWGSRVTCGLKRLSLQWWKIRAGTFL